jgi:hypothetical protein
VAAISLSAHVRSAVRAEREAVAARLEMLHAQAERLHALVEIADREVDEAARLLRHLDEILGLAPQLSLGSLDGEIRGQKLRELAVQLLRQKKGRGAVIHYREWYDLVRKAGVRVAGKDPLATFLTHVSRADGVVSVRPRSGLYRLAS